MDNCVDKLWKPVRKVANPMFNHKSVIAMSDKFNKHIDSLCEKLEEHLGQGSFDLLKLCIRFTMEQIFGILELRHFPLSFIKILF